MKYALNSHNNPATDSQDCVVIPVFSEDKKVILSNAGNQLDKASAGEISSILDKGDFKANTSDTQMLYDVAGIKASRVLLVGCGKSSDFEAKTVNQVSQAASKTLQKTSIKSVSCYLSDSITGKPKSTAITQTIIGFADSLYQLQDYKSKKKDAPSLEEVCVSLSNGFDESAQTALDNGIAISEGMKLTRDLANHPGNVCTPTFIAETATSLANDYKSVDIDVLEEADMEKLGMHSFLSVSKGSDEPGKMIILQYFGAKNKKQQPIALVGKGVTFDTGGISLKPGANMDEMKFDMGGAAGMLGTLKACAEMQLDINVVVVLAAAENMPSARASKPGDIVTSMKGITIEVLNTDAEGRLVLCDALTYVGKYNPSIVIDAATLTGACIVALGHHICAVLSNDDALANDLMDAGNTIHDRAWRLPMGDDYKKQLKSSFADLGNIGAGGAGTITAACFLGEFTKDYKWAHLDIAGTAWKGKDATGRPVPLLSQFLINQANK
ncbi:MAG: leucyl aminopeptidase [Cocleimonas sp.]|nr:leucyl aminopeptidase [Cocleimonas sp.]